MLSLAQADELSPFTSDGCSAFPDGTFAQQDLWLSCCTEHDRAYWQGGTFSEKMAADNALRECVAALGEGGIAYLMQAGVLVGGSAYYPTSFRWGYGWEYPRPYKPLSAGDFAKVKSAREEADSNK